MKTSLSAIVRRTALLSCCIVSLCLTAAHAAKYCGEIQALKGVVEVNKGANGWFKAVQGMPVQAKDRLRTGAASSCNLELDDGSLIYVAEKTEASIEYIELTQEKHDSVIALWVGKVLNNIQKSRPTKMKVRCPSATIAVRGTQFAVEVSTSGKTNVGVFEGRVAVSSGATSGTAPAVALSSGAVPGVAVSTAAPAEAASDEVDVNADEETTVAPGDKPAKPTRLQALMQKNKEQMDALRQRVQELKEKLKRTPPEEIEQARQKALDRYLALKQERDNQKESFKSKRDELRNRQREK